MVEPIRLAVFDVAGTTVLDGDAVVDSMQDALGRRRVEVPRQEIVALMGFPEPQAITMLLGKHSRLNGGSLRPLAERVLNDFLAGVKQRYRDGPGIAPAEDALEVFAALRHAGITVALDTGCSREVLDVLLQRLGWQNGDPIDLTVASDEGARGRPFPDLIRIAMARAQVLSPQAVAKIGDHINADEPDVLDYDTSFKPAPQEAIYEPNAYRASDHDVVVIGVDPIRFGFSGLDHLVHDAPRSIP